MVCEVLYYLQRLRLPASSLVEVKPNVVNDDVQGVTNIVTIAGKASPLHVNARGGMVCDGVESTLPMTLFDDFLPLD